MKKKKTEFDRLYLGIVLGLLVPIITFYIYYQLKFGEIPFFEYLASLHHYRLLFKILSLCVLTDLPVFYILLQWKKLKTARGVVMACFFFAFAVMGYRIFN